MTKLANVGHSQCGKVPGAENNGVANSQKIQTNPNNGRYFEFDPPSADNMRSPITESASGRISGRANAMAPPSLTAQIIFARTGQRPRCMPRISRAKDKPAPGRIVIGAGTAHRAIAGARSDQCRSCS
ncbi:MAG: hypothetical protein JSS45_02380 [Proteobacteria bacterium]|nr:hypothetical protein [Pseudomonadota bacterium]